MLREEAVDAVRVKMELAATAELKVLSRGLCSLGSIASTAPLFGLLSTCIFMLNSFKGGGGGSPRTTLVYFAHALSSALIPTALSLVVATMSSIIYRTLQEKARELEGEMNRAASELMQYLLTSS